MLTTDDLLSLSPEQQVELLEALREGPAFALTQIQEGEQRAKQAVRDGTLREDLYHRLTAGVIDLSKVGWDDGATWSGAHNQDPTLEAVRQAVAAETAPFAVVGGSRWQRSDLRGVLTSPYRPGAEARPFRSYPPEPPAVPPDSWLFLAIEDLLGVPVSEQRAFFERVPASVQRVITAPTPEVLERARPFVYAPLVAVDRVIDLRTVPPVAPRFV